MTSSRSLPIANFSPPLPPQPVSPRTRSASAGAAQRPSLKALLTRSLPATPESPSDFPTSPLPLSPSPRPDSPTLPFLTVPKIRTAEPDSVSSSASFLDTGDEASSPGHRRNRPISERSDPFALGLGVYTPVKPSPTELDFHAILMRSFSGFPSVLADNARLVTFNVGGQVFTTSMATLNAQSRLDSRLVRYVRSLAVDEDLHDDILPSPEANASPIRFEGTRANTPSLSSSASSISEEPVKRPSRRLVVSLQLFLDRDPTPWTALMRWIRTGQVPPPHRLDDRELLREEADWLGFQALLDALPLPIKPKSI